MKKLLLFAITALGFLLGNAQVNLLDKLEAIQLVESNKAILQLSDVDISNSIVSSTYKNKYAGTTMVYLQQTYKGIVVYNQMQTLAFKDGKLVSQSGEFLKNIENYANVKSEVPVVNASGALLAAIADRKLISKQNPTIIGIDEYEHKVEFGNMGISRENITATLMWFPSEIGKKMMTLGWQVYIIQNNTSDYWLVNIDATNKNTISIGNLTVYCNWDDPSHKNDHEHLIKNTAQNINQPFDFLSTIINTNGKTNSPSIVNSANYRVVPYPAESPLHPGGTPALVSNPWDLSGAGNPATTLKWHSVGATNYNITRGNNVWAQEDQNNNNGTSATQVTSSTTSDPLNFDFVPDFLAIPTQTTPATNQQFNTTNLFYWNNIIHDLTYQYGFDEAARNFQADNMGRGGNGGDYVLADAQDGGGTNNANFATPADGGNGRMQMYIWTQANPDRDGDVDNGIVAHEYAHGISNRLTGNGSGCLGNAEQMGEGWSDYYGLMYTQNWATSTLTSGFDSPRGVGTYAINQSNTGLGIRSQRYCTNFAINNKVYAASIPSESHARGEIWCAVLWEMTWGIINQVGSINTNLFNANGTGGNSIALKLVTEGMKLQPCSPGFISSRDAILQADQILYNGAYRCTILEAFRKRGMGLGASQGSSGSVTDQIPSFTNGGSSITLLQNGVTAVPEGLNISYSNKIIADACSAYTNYTITDTLPLNVTYVSGGTYNAANRVVSFVVNQAPGTTGFYNFVVNINNGTYFTPSTLLNETVPATMPATWTATTTVPAGGNLFDVSTLQTSSAPNAFFCTNETISTDKRLELTTSIALPTGASAYPKLSFMHKYNTEDGWDGGVVEISTNGGTTWTDLGVNMLTNKYNNTIGAGVGNNLANRDAFSGLISTFINTTANLSAYAGQTAKIRFRFASDDNTAGAGTPTGWFIDDINITNSATVSMRSSFFNASNVRVNYSDTVTLILPPTITTPPVISAQPSNTTVCAGTNATFTSGASGSGVTYSWEVSINAGATWSPTTPAVTTSTLTLTAVTIGMNNNRYRMIATNTSGSVTSNPAILTVIATPASPAVSSPVNYCQGATPVALTATGTNLLWYLGASGGTGNATPPAVSTTTVGTTFYYVTQSNGGCESLRSAITVNVTTIPTAPIVTSPVNYCQNVTATALTATGSNLLWYTVPTAGTSSTTAPTPSTTTIGTVNYYVSQINGTCESPRATIAVITGASSLAPVVSSPIAYCQGATATALTATGTGLLWYTVSVGGTSTSTAITPATNTVGSITYYVSQTTTCGESPRASIIVNVAATPAAPTAASPISYCQGNTATALTATGTNLLWYGTNATGGTGSATATNPSTAAAGSTTYYVSQTLGTCESPRTAITVNVGAAPAITTQPQDITSCATTATFSVVASGSLLTYQWQVSTDGGVTYTNISGATASSITLTGLTAAQSNNKYRVVVSSASCPSATSVAVSAKVGTPPVIVLTAAPVTNFNPRINGGLYTTVSPPSATYVYQWKRNNNVITNTTTSLTKANGLLDEFGTYVVTVTDNTTGCFGVSNAIAVTDIEVERNTLFISPNPTNGLMNISFYNDNPSVNTNRKITVYDAKGAQIITKTFTITGNYVYTTIDLTKYAAGNYSIVLLNDNGKKIASEIVVKY